MRISTRRVGGRVGVDCNFIINFMFLLFPVFGGVEEIGGKFDISQ